MVNPHPDFRYDLAAVTAAHVVNTMTLKPDQPKAELFGQIVFLILEAIYAAEEISAARFTPSVN